MLPNNATRMRKPSINTPFYAHPVSERLFYCGSLTISFSAMPKSRPLRNTTVKTAYTKYDDADNYPHLRNWILRGVGLNDDDPK